MAFFVIGEGQLLVFLKSPRPGRVKTRLARSVGDEAACALYRGMVEDLLQRLSPLSRVELRITPDATVERHADWLRPGWRARGQGEGSLGQRLSRAFRDHARGGARRILAIGSDTPDLALSHLQEGYSALERAPVVLGPARDGGYWLIGARGHAPRLFEEIPWSTARVLEATLERVEELGHHAILLETLEDVDDEESLERWQGRFPGCQRTAKG